MAWHELFVVVLGIVFLFCVLIRGMINSVVISRVSSIMRLGSGLGVFDGAGDSTGFVSWVCGF